VPRARFCLLKLFLMQLLRLSLLSPRQQLHQPLRLLLVRLLRLL